MKHTVTHQGILKGFAGGLNTTHYLTSSEYVLTRGILKGIAGCTEYQTHYLTFSGYVRETPVLCQGEYCPQGEPNNIE